MKALWPLTILFLLACSPPLEPKVDDDSGDALEQKEKLEAFAIEFKSIFADLENSKSGKSSNLEKCKIEHTNGDRKEQLVINGEECPIDFEREWKKLIDRSANGNYDLDEKFLTSVGKYEPASTIYKYWLSGRYNILNNNDLEVGIGQYTGEFNSIEFGKLTMAMDFQKRRTSNTYNETLRVELRFQGLVFTGIAETIGIKKIYKINKSKISKQEFDAFFGSLFEAIQGQIVSP